MPVNPIKNTVYQMLLPMRAPSPKNQMTHETQGEGLAKLSDYEKLLCRHHVLGASLLIRDGEREAKVYTSTMLKPVHRVTEDSLFRTASITKMSTAAVTMMLVEEGAFSLDTPVSELLPAEETEALRGVTVQQLLSHTSGLRDTVSADTALKENWPVEQLLAVPGTRQAEPGEGFSYCNLNYGLLGCILEYASSMPVQELFADRLFRPLGMRGGIDPARLDRELIVPISRVLPYREGQDMVVPNYAASPMESADPHHHYHHTAGSLYTDAESLSRLLRMIAGHGEWEGKQIMKPETVRLMVREYGRYGKSGPNLGYGFGLLLIEDRELSKYRIIGHQGYAYGCADGAFYEEGTGRQVVFLNGGCSEARKGHLGISNRDVIRYAFQEEIPAWK